MVVVEINMGLWRLLRSVGDNVGRSEWWIWLLGCVYGIGGGNEVDWH